MAAADKELIDRTLEVWQPHTSRVLTREDAREITENIAGFFRTLLDWHAAECSSQAAGVTHVPRESNDDSDNQTPRQIEGRNHPMHNDVGLGGDV